MFSRAKKKWKKKKYEIGIMQFFSVDAMVVPDNMKKLSSKVAHNRPPMFFQYCRSAQAVENPYSFFNVSYTWYKSLHTDARIPQFRNCKLFQWVNNF